MNNNLIPAATVLVLRDSDDGMEVLMVKRSKRPPFENLYVFPGGKIDKEDHFDDYQKYCDVLNNEIASEKLGLDSGGLSYWIACIRECFEEVGILLAKKQSGEFLDLDGADKEKFDVYRDKLIKNEKDASGMMNARKKHLSEVLNISPQKISVHDHHSV